MFYKDVPSLMTINHGAKLRLAATRLQAHAAILFDKGCEWGKEKLVPFWQYQKAQVHVPAGHPSDGPYLPTAFTDLRILCYNVLSSIRLQGNKPEDVKVWETFCDFFINAAYSLDTNRSKVDKIKLDIVYPIGKTSYEWADTSVIVNITGIDATGKTIPASKNNPLLGTVDWMLVNEGTKDLQGKWRDSEIKVDSTPHSLTVGSISTRKAGTNTLKIKYTFEGKEVVSEVTYNRLDESGKLPTEPPVEPTEVKTVNGITA